MDRYGDGKVNMDLMHMDMVGMGMKGLMGMKEVGTG